MRVHIISDIEGVAEVTKGEQGDGGEPLYGEAALEVEFNRPQLVDPYRFRAGVEIVDEREIVSRADDWWTAWRQFYF